MGLEVVGLVLLAALLHAGWNGVVKAQGDPLIMMGLVIGSGGLCALILTPFVTVPMRDAWPWLGGSVVLHTGYALFLLNAYRHGGLGKVYPIARGVAPVIVAAMSTVVLGETVPPLVLAGSLVICAGVMSLALVGDDGGGRHRRAVSYALGTAVFIAAYTMVDGIGARRNGSAHGYIVWMSVFNAVSLVAIAWLSRGNAALAGVRAHWRAGLGGGVMSLAAYWLVVWAMTLGPMAPVAALRETSVIFAALLSALVLKEGFGAMRMISAVAVTGGVVLMRL